MEKETTSCGLCGWRPTWLQRLARKEVYTVLYAVLGAVQGMGYTYLSSCISTIEKQFGIKSQEAAWIFSGNEISQIAFIFALPFLRKIKRRTMWTSLALLASAFGLFLCSMPYLVRDKTQYEGGWKTQSVPTRDICADHSGREDQCEKERIRDWGGMFTIFLGFFISGIGTSFFYSFGLPYIDDNISKNSSPVVLSVVMAGRTVGPALGYILGGSTLKMYVSPGRGGDLKEGDPGFLGAWWLGFIIIAVTTSIVAPFLALFPERLPSEDDTEAKRMEKERKEELQTTREYVVDTINCAKRLFKNKVYVFNSLSTIFFLFGFIGFGTFVPKYFEYHFRRNASSSGRSGGLSKSLGSVIGILLSGVVLAKFKFRARTVSLWNVILGFLGAAFFIAMSFVACPKLDVYGGVGESLPCQQNCGCSDSSFQPTCSTDGKTLFFSPCHAGCREMTSEAVMRKGRKKEQKLYSDCSCVKDAAAKLNLTTAEPWWKEPELESPLLDGAVSASKPDGAVGGYCPFDCSKQFSIIIGLLTIFSLLGATGRLGNQLVSLRAIHPQDKAASMIIMVSALSLFVFLPSPIIFGAIMDNACLVWGQNCGETTNCLLYDTDTMRNTLCYFVVTCILLATFADIGVWWNCKNINIFDTEEDTSEVDDTIEKVELKNAGKHN
jgi:hypothetical protein